MLRILVAAIGFGVANAAILSIAAVGFTLQFSVTNIFNLAYTDIMTVGAFVALALNAAGLSIWAALPIAGISTAVLSFLINRSVLQPLLRRGTTLFGMVIATISVGLILWNTVLAIVRPGYSHFAIEAPTTYRFAGQILTSLHLTTIGLGLAAMLAVHLLLRYSKLGKAMRAVAVNPDLARASGIPSRRVVDITWLLSGFLCGVAGVVLTVNLPAFSTTTARGLLTLILAAVVLGGVGHPYGAMLGALTLGVSSEIVAALLAPQWKDVFALAVLVVILLIRPQGIIAEATADKAVAAA